MKTILSIICLVFACRAAQSQSIQGKVIDGETGEPLSYVRIGVKTKNVGTISHNNGEFLIQSDEIIGSDSITFSMIGYATQSIAVRDITPGSIVKLTPAVYKLKPVEITADEIIQLEKLGRPVPTKVTIGHSGTSEWGIGGEWGLKIPVDGNRFLLQKIAFHTRFNTVDSVMFRLMIYRIADNLPADAIHTNEIYVTSRKRDRWIVKDIADHKIVVDKDVAVTMEVLRIWYSKTGENQLFFTYGNDAAQLTTYSRESSQAPWLVAKMPPLALYVEARRLNE